jgi:hypothetical protein
MTTPTTPAEDTGRPASALEFLLAHRREFRVALFVLAAALSAIPITLAVRSGLRNAVGPVFLWGAALTLAALAAALYDLAAGAERREGDVDRLRLELLALGGVCGLATALLGFGLPLTGEYRAKIAGGLESWQANAGALFWPALALLGGLVLMFLSLQLARGMERTSPQLRWLVYGYNAVLSSLLLLGVLAVPNVLAYASPFDRFFGHTFDWTKAQINSLDPQTVNLLTSLQEPVKVYVLLSRNSVVTQDTVVMLENCRTQTDKLSYEVVPLDASDQSRLLGLMQKYKLSDPQGLLVVVGKDDKTQHQFIKVDELASRGGMRDGYVYSGENALVNALTFLIEGKVTVYFTQGAGELELNPAGFGAADAGLRTLQSRLTERKNFTVKELKLGPGGERRVPSDADVVVVARPTRPLAPGAVDALRDYMRGTAKKGKLILLLDPVVAVQNNASTFLATGLEPLLAEFNVRAGGDVILTLSGGNPKQIQAVTNPRSTNPVARAFYPHPLLRTVFTFTNASTVDALNRAGGGATTVEQLVLVPPDQEIWAEKDASRDPAGLAAALRKDPDKAEKVLSQQPLCLAVAVSEGGGGNLPRDRAHASLVKETPRLVVFGNADWVDDQALRGAKGQANYDLFTSCLSWLRERPTVGKTTIGPKERKVYDLNVPETARDRLLYLPLGLMVLAVLGIGCGVWVVRRR